MREYKFRGKSKYYDKWVYGFYLEQDVYNLGSKKTKKDLIEKNASLIVEDSKRPSATPVMHETVGQYTGLKDKNGKEIYKGDIVYVLCEDENAIILWLNENAKFILEFDDWFSDFDCYYGKDLEVIGNIYDNKNLLEKGG